jgi:hypothetical protein
MWSEFFEKSRNSDYEKERFFLKKKSRKRRVLTVISAEESTARK